MTFATLQDAGTYFALAGLLIGGAVIPSALAVWVIRMGRRNGRPNTARIVIATVLVLTSVPGWAYGGIMLVIAVVVARCPPDGLDCPL